MLRAISPIDGRYIGKTKDLQEFFSEYAIIRYRAHIEIQYFIYLYKLGLPEFYDFPHQKIDALRQIAKDFSPADAEVVKRYEKTTNHDVKAVEYWLKEKFDELGIGKFKEFIHFALTSQDINNTAMPLAVKHASLRVYIPLLDSLIEDIRKLAEKTADIPMLARTHGQPASPTRFGKEMMVFVERLENQRNLLKEIDVVAKFGGATGNFNAHIVAYPDVDWKMFADNFVNNGLGLRRLHYTTQIEHYDHLAALFQNYMRINTILIDLARDIWQYISMDYLKQSVVKGEVGSSTMPHKVNPIDFENAEGNLGIANALYAHLAAKLPISRLQRDLTDSTVSRNIGVPMAHSVIAFKSLKQGLKKIKVDGGAMMSELQEHWNVLAEPIQIVLRKIGYPEPYEKLKELTRGTGEVTQESLHAFIDSLDIDVGLKAELKQLRPETYLGI